MTEDEYYVLLGKTVQVSNDIDHEAEELQKQVVNLGVIYGRGYHGSIEDGRYDKQVSDTLNRMHLLLSSIEGNAAWLRHLIDDHWINSGNEQ